MLKFYGVCQNLLSKIQCLLPMFTKFDCHGIKSYFRKPMKPFVLQAQRPGVSLQMVNCKQANPYITTWFSKEKVPGSPRQCQQLSFLRLSSTDCIFLTFLHSVSFLFSSAYHSSFLHLLIFFFFTLFLPFSVSESLSLGDIRGFPGVLSEGWRKAPGLDLNSQEQQQQDSGWWWAMAGVMIYLNVIE